VDLHLSCIDSLTYIAHSFEKSNKIMSLILIC